MVKENIASALIMEDDADWDVMLKNQLVELARGARFLQGEDTPLESGGNSPYGDNWDMLWVGHCGARNRENEEAKYWVIRNDPTAIPEKLYQYRARLPNLDHPLLSGNHVRVIYEPVRGLCATGYALSLQGAQRLLYHQSVLGKALVSDRALNRVCTTRYMGMRCFAPYPALIGSHRAVGPTGKDSDRIGMDGGYHKVPETALIVFPVRVNMERLMRGKDSRIPSQYPRYTIFKEIDRSIELPHGDGVFVKPGAYGENEEERWSKANPKQAELQRIAAEKEATAEKKKEAERIAAEKEATRLREAGLVKEDPSLRDKKDV